MLVIVSILFGHLLLLLLRIHSRRRREFISYGQSELASTHHKHHERWMISCQEKLFF
jgi:hypothetical protein